MFWPITRSEVEGKEEQRQKHSEIFEQGKNESTIKMEKN